MTRCPPGRRYQSARGKGGLVRIGWDEALEIAAAARFDGGTSVSRGVPVREVGGRRVTTVYDLLFAQYGVGRDGLPGEWPAGYQDAAQPCTPAWQEAITSVPAGAVVRVAREFAHTAERTRGRCMIVMGAGTNHWFHPDTIYRSFLTLLMLTGCQGVNAGGWAHYVGQEKVRPYAGWQQLVGRRLGAPVPAGAASLLRPPLHRDACEEPPSADYFCLTSVQ